MDDRRFENWMRDYDPTTGRYMQADPLGLVDGASIYGYVTQSPLRFYDFVGLRQGDRGNFDENRQRGGEVDTLIQGIGSYFRGIYRCLKYCEPETTQTQYEMIQKYRNDTDFRQCINFAISDYLSKSKNKRYISGRFGTGVGVSAGSSSRFGLSGGIVGGTLAGIAIQGDLGHAVAQGQSTAQAISSGLTGDPNAISEELICECIERFGGDK